VVSGAASQASLRRPGTEAEAYDSKSDSWAALAPMPQGRHGFGGGVIGDSTYFVAAR